MYKFTQDMLIFTHISEQVSAHSTSLCWISLYMMDEKLG